MRSVSSIPVIRSSCCVANLVRLLEMISIRDSLAPVSRIVKISFCPFGPFLSWRRSTRAVSLLDLTMEFFSIVPLINIGTNDFKISVGRREVWDLANNEVI